MDAYIGEIRPFAFGFVPEGWLFCDGSQQYIQLYQGLFATLWTRFGGDGVTYFKLPDLRARAVTSQYTNTMPPSGMPKHTLGAIWGQGDISLSWTEMPSHTHGAKGYGSTAGVTQVGTPDNQSYLGLLRSNSGTFTYDIWSSNAPTGFFNPQALGSTPGVPPSYGAPHPNNQPYLPLNFCICWNGNFMPDPNDFK